MDIYNDTPITPGTWSASMAGGAPIRIYARPGRRCAKANGGEIIPECVAEIRTPGDPRGYLPHTLATMEEAWANARLFVAAPQLLAGYRMVLERLATDPIQDDELADFCRAQIAAAEKDSATGS